MLKCPNKSHPDWKALVEKTGSEINAYKEYIKNGMEIPNIDDLKGETKIKPGVPELFESNFAIFAESKTSDEVINKLLANKVIDKKCS